MNKCNICKIVHEKSEPMTAQEKEEIIKICKRITDHDNGVPQQTPDGKVLDYLERARQVLINAKMGNWTFGNGHNPEENHIIEIAKLLQREESK